MRLNPSMKADFFRICSRAALAPFPGCRFIYSYLNSVSDKFAVGINLNLI